MDTHASTTAFPDNLTPGQRATIAEARSYLGDIQVELQEARDMLDELTERFETDTACGPFIILDDRLWALIGHGGDAEFGLDHLEMLLTDQLSDPELQEESDFCQSYLQPSLPYHLAAD